MVQLFLAKCVYVCWRSCLFTVYCDVEVWFLQELAHGNLISWRSPTGVRKKVSLPWEPGGMALPVFVVNMYKMALGACWKHSWTAFPGIVLALKNVAESLKSKTSTVLLVLSPFCPGVQCLPLMDQFFFFLSCSFSLLYVVCGTEKLYWCLSRWKYPL